MTRVLSLRRIASISAALWLFSQSAMAQSDAETLADLRACGTVERDGARLACFDGVLAAEQVAAAEAGVAGRRDSRAPGAASALVSGVSGQGRGESRAVRAADVPGVSAANAAAAARDEHNESKAPETEQPRTVTIVDVNDDLPGAARFTDDAGRVFVQTSGGTPRGGYPDVPFEARIEDGIFGSLFLYISERRRVRGDWAD
jgi:hypothetical protein